MTYSIDDEDPKYHWGFVNVKDRIVLDLGCAMWAGVNPRDTQSTPSFWLEHGAKRVIGCDANKRSLDLVIEMLRDMPNCELFVENITSSKQILDLIRKYNPDVIKCDIETYEKCFEDITKEDMSSVVELAIEYHDLELKNLCTRKIKEWGFMQVDNYPEHNTVTNGVFHAWR